MSESVNQSERYLNSIPLLGEDAKLERIRKGYSSDGKYIVFDRQGAPKYILRTYGIEQDRDKRLEFNRLAMMEEQDVECSRPIEIGVLHELGLGYMIVSYIEGNEATDELPLLTEEDQFRVGIQAGLELQKIHRVSCPEPIGPWADRMAAKHRRYRIAYANCGAAIPNDAKLLSYIDNNLRLMNGRSNIFQHDDYHVGNLIVKDGNLSGIIDFNRSDWGDPLHEFVKVGIFSSEVSVPFSVGQIAGYHNRKEPGEAFWPLYSLYLAMTLVSSVVWVLKVKPEELDVMMAKIDKVMEDHDGFELTVPKWYGRFQPGWG
ncbi:aminoglycoside phosphotransferase family protein [Paenibacillus arenilitoris]|uniref:Phosphotransferase n=1 Tax=Paenibacillus arenilitoris TaxID=2772299 RepID=A0A927HAP7_9BACL|nr:phosphotransferase [Paenibacillus arenilitoris]MBD2872824.1 phosphotransferase [Paenibacillus arenilitoris]